MALSKHAGAGRFHLLTARLRSLDGDDPSVARGRLTLWLRALRDGSGYELAVGGLLLNRAGETFIAGDLVEAVPGPPRQNPGPPRDGSSVLSLFRDVAASCRVIGLGGTGVIDAALGRHLLADPGDFAAVLATGVLPEGAIFGVFQRPGPPRANPGPPRAEPGPPRAPPSPCFIEVGPGPPRARSQG